MPGRGRPATPARAATPPQTLIGAVADCLRDAGRPLAVAEIVAAVARNGFPDTPGGQLKVRVRRVLWGERRAFLRDAAGCYTLKRAPGA